MIPVFCCNTNKVMQMNYCKTLIIRVTLFSRWNHAAYIHEILFTRFDISCFIILTTENIGKDLQIYAKIKSSRIKSVLQYPTGSHVLTCPEMVDSTSRWHLVNRTDPAIFLNHLPSIHLYGHVTGRLEGQGQFIVQNLSRGGEQEPQSIVDQTDEERVHVVLLFVKWC